MRGLHVYVLLVAAALALAGADCLNAYWLHVAIDRYTGQVVDKQLEVVNE